MLDKGLKLRVATPLEVLRWLAEVAAASDVLGSV